MIVLVTGSSGRIGSRLVSTLMDRGMTVRGFDVRPRPIENEGYDEEIGSLQDRAAVERSVAGVEAVVHLGAFMSWRPEDENRLFQVNCEGTRVLLGAAACAGVRRLVFASSGEVYPENSPVRQPILENHPLRPSSHYGLTKLMGEELVRFFARTRKLETVILRFSHVQDASELLDENSFFSGPRFFFGPRIRQQEQLGNHDLAEQMRRSDPGTPAHILPRSSFGRPFRMHITDTRDIVEGIVLALEADSAAGETFNLGATEPVDFELLVSKMSEITGYPVVAFDYPGEGVFYTTSNEKIRRKLGFVPRWSIDRMLDEAAGARKARLEKATYRIVGS
ncbi:MAG: NAD(P)-dependent oxidoreductase [Albidovulum sp.]|nr:NAD(P)-dependent oxidoreductase [Albidovulum sp.]